MFFNSIAFAVFLPIVFTLYWTFSKKYLKYQNTLLLFASYFFYACWDWRFLFLLIFSTFLDFYTGIKINSSTTSQNKKFWFWLSIVTNLGFLGIFKYYNFFVSSFANALANVGFQVNPSTLGIILPVGISFYTFHGLSYVIDIYKDRIRPEKNLIDYSVFVSFFPLLVAGPIERASHLLPQIKSKREFDQERAVDGLRQILWGLLKKVVIADQCAFFANEIFNNTSNHSGSTLLIGAVLFAFQIYGDFSGYSDIALGTARLFGIELLQNFSYPYFSRDIAEFWRRWHISLSTWFRDYLYIPLGGSKGPLWKKVRNIFIIFLVSGFWHGANWTFIVWGLLNAIYILPSVIFKTNRSNLGVVAQGKLLPNFKEATSIITTFALTTFAWIFFRAENLHHAFFYIENLFSTSFLTFPSIFPKMLFITIILFLIVEWLGREEKYAIARIPSKLPFFFRWTVYYYIIWLVIYHSGSEEQFIYFQF
jgi:alginate O-acetyltransferase complex protein AlgI